MPIVPTVKIAETQLRPSPTVFQSAHGATPEAFGADVGQALGGVGGQLTAKGEELAAADRRLTLRREANDRVRIVDGATTTAEQLFAQERDEGQNFATDEGIQTYNAQLTEAFTKAASDGQNHGAESQLVLAGNLERLFKQFQDKGTAAGMATLNAEEARRYGEFTVAQFNMVRTAPELADIARENVEERLAELSPTDTPEETEAKRQVAYESIALAAFDKHMSIFDFAEARAVLNDQEKFLSIEVMRQSRNRIAIAEAEFFKQTGNKQTLISKDQILVDAAGDTIAEGPKSKDKEENVVVKPGDKVFDVKTGELLFENPALPEEPDPLLGRGLVGRSTELLVEPQEDGSTLLADYVARGEGDNPAMDRLIESLIALTVQKDPDTGLRSAVPPAYAEALRARGRNIESFFDPSFEQGSTSFPELPALPFNVTAGASQEPAPTGGEVAPTDQEVAPTSQEVAPTSRINEVLGPELDTLLAGKTMAERIFEGFTGPGAAIRSLAGRTPFVGSGAGIVDTVRSAFPLATRRLVTVLQQNPRFAVTERAGIEKDLDIAAKLFDNPTALLGKMTGINLFLQSLESELTRALETPQPLAQRQADTVTLRLLQDFRERFIPTVLYEQDQEKIKEQLNEFFANAAPDEAIVALDQDGSWELFFNRLKTEAE